MIDYERHDYEIETLGFTIVPDFITPEMTARLKAALAEALEADAARFGRYRAKARNHVMELASHGGVFLEFLEHPQMQRFYRRFLGNDCVLYTYSSTLLAPNEAVSAQNVHVDSGRWVQNHVTGLQMTLAIDDFNADNGASWYLPGSHRTQAPPSAETFERYAVMVNRPAGAALIWDPHCYHRAGDNKTDATRYALSTYAVRGYIKPRFDYPRLLGPEVGAKASPELRAFLGYTKQPPETVEQFYEYGEKARPAG
ncbi:MAG: phytanoyl-CoA dioxygenase family protein [Proteobacteria bacterium]|nr:phytanoyl-CoA dioxygenase family protein [Pseudomonadota bacterium]